MTNSEALPAGPLAGVRVLDFTEIIAGPLSTMLLADMGADVIKVEPCEGEPWRLQGQFMPLESKNFMSLNRGKQGLAINLKTEEGRSIIHALARDADVVVVNYRPDVPARLGIDYETLSGINPRILYAANSAFGTSGPHASRPGYDIILQAMSGLMAGAGNTTASGAPATVGGTAVADAAAGLILAWSVCAALYARERTGLGQRIDTSLFGAALLVQTSRYISVEEREAGNRAAIVQTATALRRAGASYTEIVNALLEARGMAGVQAANIYYRVYQTADGFLAVGCLSNALRMKFAKALGIIDPRLDVPVFQQQTEEAKAIARGLVPQVEALMRSRSSADWQATLDTAGVPCGPVTFPEELFDDPHVQANELLVEVDHVLAGKLKMVGVPVQMSRTPLRARGASPALGQHTDHLLRSLGLTDEAIAGLRARGVVR